MQTNMINKTLMNNVRKLVKQARAQIQQTINSIMVKTYWELGRLIVEDEQQGKKRAEYGKQQLEALATQLTDEFGKGFNIRNLRNMRGLYLAFPIRYSLRTELSWTHYRHLIRIKNDKARAWYINEAIEQGWSARALDRQISVFYYERLLSSKEKAPVQEEAKAKTSPLKDSAKDYLRDPYLLRLLKSIGQTLSRKQA